MNLFKSTIVLIVHMLHIFSFVNASIVFIKFIFCRSLFQFHLHVLLRCLCEGMRNSDSGPQRCRRKNRLTLFTSLYLDITVFISSCFTFHLLDFCANTCMTVKFLSGVVKIPDLEVINFIFRILPISLTKFLWCRNVIDRSSWLLYTMYCLYFF